MEAQPDSTHGENVTDAQDAVPFLKSNLREETDMDDCVKIFEGINKKAKCGVCVGVRVKGHPDNPEDVVALCTGDLDEKGHPEDILYLTVEEAQAVGVALINAGLVKELIEKGTLTFSHDK